MRSHISKLVIWGLIHSLALPYPIAQAVLNQATNANAVNANAIQSGGLSCSGDSNSVKDFCNQIMQPVDAQFCADHGVQTEAGVMPNTNRAYAPAGTCNIPIFEGENCTQVNQLVNICKFANSQVQSQCAAYLQADSAGPLEYTVLGLDIAAAGICATACAADAAATPIVGTFTVGRACAVSGCAASMGQLAAIIKSTESPVSRMFQGLMSAAGAYTAWMSAGKDGGFCGTGLGVQNEVEKEEFFLAMLLIQNAYAEEPLSSEGLFGKPMAPNPDQVLQNIPPVNSGQVPPTISQEAMDIVNQPMSETLKKYSQQADSADKVQQLSPAEWSKKFQQNEVPKEVPKDAAGGDNWSKERKMSCASAAMFAVLAGLRYKNINSMNQTKESACNSVAKLASSAAATGGSVTPAQLLGATGRSSITGGGGYGMGGSTGTGVSNVNSAAQNGLQCIQAQGLTNCAIGGASTAGAMDANLLGQSGLDRFAAPMAQRLNFDDLKKQIEKGGATAGGLMAGAVGGGSGAAGQFGQGLAKLAQATFESKVFDSIGMGAGTAYAGGGGGGGGRAPAGDGGMMAALGNMFGGAGQDQAGSAAAAAFQNFGTKQPDIFHAGSPMNIFQIVSDKIQKVNYRVR